MAENDKEVVVTTNEYGIADDDYAKERAAARAAAGTARTAAQEDKEEKPQPEVTKAAAEETKTEEIEETTEQQKTVDESKETKAKEPEKKQDTDPLADLPEEWKEKVTSQLKAAKDESEYFKKRYDSDIGRINAYQGKYEDIRRTLLAKEQELAALKKAPPKPLKDLDSPRIKEAIETGNTDIVEMMEEARAAISKEFEDRFVAIQKLQEQERLEAAESQNRAAVDDFNRKLNERFSNWMPVVYELDDKGKLVLGEDKLPRFNEGWLEYLRDQPPSLRQALEAPQSAEDAIWAIDNYNGWLKKKGYVKEEEIETKSPTIPNADAIQKKRDGDLKRKAPPKGHEVALSPTPQIDIDNDEELRKKWRALARKAVADNDPSLYSPKNIQ